MASIHIKRTGKNSYMVRLYDRVVSINLGEMGEEALHGHLLGRNLLNHSSANVDSLEVGDEITLNFCTSF